MDRTIHIKVFISFKKLGFDYRFSTKSNKQNIMYWNIQGLSNI